MTSGVLAAPPELDTASIRRGFLRACVIGAAVAGVIFTWMLLIGRLDLLHTEGLSGFYDAQAHALLGGHWDIPAGKLGFEAFVIDGKQYMYFGPWPALLRLPIAAVTTSLDGELTQLSMLLAFAVLMVATVRLLWRVRTIMRPDRPLARLEQWAVGVFVLVVGAGSVVLFLASRPVVYHEASLWGVALAIGAFEATLAFVLRPGRGALAWACVLTALSLMSRSSVGLGALAVLGAVLAARLLVLLADRRSWDPARRLVRVFGLPTDERARGYVAPLAIGIGIVLALYVYVNWVKFGDLFSVPLDRHYTTFIDPIRRTLYADQSSLFAAKYLPTDLLAMFRPDAIGLDRLFPFLTFPATATVLGGLTYAALDPSSSIPSSMPFLFLLALVGAVVVFRPRRDRDPEAPSAALLRVFALAGLVGGIASVALPYVNQRYQADWLALLIVLGAAGLFATLHILDAFTERDIRAQRTHRRRAGWATAIVVVGAALAVFSVWANFSLALLYQRAYSPFPLNSERAAFVRFQHALDEKLPGGPGFDVERGDALPRKAAAVGTLFVLGDCEGVYWSDGRNWLPIEQTHATGRYPSGSPSTLRRPAPARPCCAPGRRARRTSSRSSTGTTTTGASSSRPPASTRTRSATRSRSAAAARSSCSCSTTRCSAASRSRSTGGSARDSSGTHMRHLSRLPATAALRRRRPISSATRGSSPRRPTSAATRGSPTPGIPARTVTGAFGTVFPGPSRWWWDRRRPGGSVDRTCGWAYQPPLDGLPRFRRARRCSPTTSISAGRLAASSASTRSSCSRGSSSPRCCCTSTRARRGGSPFTGFWARRARRLLPASSSCSSRSPCTPRSSPTRRSSTMLRSDMFATLFYGANWRFITRVSRTSRSSAKRRRCGTRGRWRSRSSSTWCGR